MDGPQARVATGADAALVTRIVADAFRDDPLWSWAMRRDDGRTDHHDGRRDRSRGPLRRELRSQRLPQERPTARF